jgi:putative peptidoglycan lipid II flippase
MGLWAFTGSRLLVTLYYSLSNIKIPFYSGILTIGLNLILCFSLMDWLGLKGLVLSVSMSAATGFIILLINIPGAVKIDKSEIIVSACRSLFFSVIMFFLVQIAADLILIPGINKFWFGTGVIFCIFLGISFYFILNFLISSPELKILKKGVFPNKL